MFRRLSIVVSVVTIAGSAPSARAQETPPADSATEERKALAVGFSLGVGTASFHTTSPGAPASEPSAGVGAGLWSAWRFTDRLGAAVDVNATYPSGKQDTPSALLVGLQYWATPKVWVKAGGGWGFLNTFDAQQVAVFETGSAFGAAVGCEVKSLQKFSIDIDAHVRFTESHTGAVRARSLTAQLGVTKRFAISAITATTYPPATAGRTAPKTGRNLFGGEVGGRSGLAGIAYERELGARVGIGVGVGSGWDIESEIASGLIPVYVSWSPLGETHRLYTSAGVALVHVSSYYRDYFVNFEPRIGWSAYGTGGIGYEHRVKNNDGFWRVGFVALYQPHGIPGGLLDMQDSGFAFVPAFSRVIRF